MDPKDFKEMSELMFKIPMHIVADWDGTNHYEIHDNQVGTDHSFFWIDIPEVFDPNPHVDWSGSEEGRRLGMLLDFACLARQYIPEVMAENIKLKEENAKLIQELGVYADSGCKKEMEFLRIFVKRVNELAEQKMLITHKLEGAHKAAMDQMAKELGL